MPAKSPNFLILCTDQQQSNSLGCAGNPIAQTPNIDALAARGMRFTRHEIDLKKISDRLLNTGK
ncbi:MAG: sulfatase-like hydrolase/transferase [Gammaproteobacteria bacterium]|nr:sulfatase-like hydrolase/transferase [Gammaproteobacteria bacterium]